MKKKRIVVIVPTYNEQDNIPAFVKSIAAQHGKLPNHELLILFSDSHSSDSTPTLVNKEVKRHKNIYYLDVGKRGLGLGLREGLRYADKKFHPDLFITMEADLSNDPGQLPDFVDKLDKTPLVVGSRYSKGGRIVNWSWWRKVLSLVANYILRVAVFPAPLHEFTNLYRGFTVDVWRRVDADIEKHNGWLFVPAFVFTCLKKNIPFVEQPIIYFDRFGGRSKMKTVSYTKDLLIYAFRFKIKQLWNIS